jgi:hypothetical protein
MKINTASLMRSMFNAGLPVYYVGIHHGEDGWGIDSEYFSSKKEAIREKRKMRLSLNYSPNYGIAVFTTRIIGGEIADAEESEKEAKGFIDERMWRRRRNKRLTRKWKQQKIGFFAS